MVTYLHSDNDAMAGMDLARIYDTRTLDHVVAVQRSNVKRSVAEVLKRGTDVVVPDDAARMCDGLLTVCGVLQMLRHPVKRVSEYLNELGAPASAQAHANAEGTGAPLRLPAPAG